MSISKCFRYLSLPQQVSKPFDNSFQGSTFLTVQTCTLIPAVPLHWISTIYRCQPTVVTNTFTTVFRTSPTRTPQPLPLADMFRRLRVSSKSKGDAWSLLHPGGGVPSPPRKTCSLASLLLHAEVVEESCSTRAVAERRCLLKCFLDWQVLNNVRHRHREYFHGANPPVFCCGCQTDNQ